MKIPRLGSHLLLAYLRKFDSLMNGNVPNHVDERRAAVLLGLPEVDLRRYSRVAGLGHVERDDRGQHMVFTYEELRRICIMAAQSSK